MPIRNLNPHYLNQDEDWEGNNIAVTCPLCKKVYIISDTRMHVGPNEEKGFRRCPNCNKSIGRVKGGRKSSGSASVEW